MLRHNHSDTNHLDSSRCLVQTCSDLVSGASDRGPAKKRLELENYQTKNITKFKNFQILCEVGLTW